MSKKIFCCQNGDVCGNVQDNCEKPAGEGEAEL